MTEKMSAPATDEEAEFLSSICQLTPQKQSLLQFAIKAIADGEDADEVFAALLVAGPNTAAASGAFCDQNRPRPPKLSRTLQRPCKNVRGKL